MITSSYVFFSSSSPGDVADRLFVHSLAAYGKITDIDAMKEDVYWAEDQWNPTTVRPSPHFARRAY